jgi:5-methylcytosine-specific restriction endonuclease McrA
MAKKTSKKASSLTAYRKGDRSPEVVKEWNDYFRPRNQKNMAKHYNDPDSKMKPRISHHEAVKRTKKYGGFVTEDPVEIEAIIDLYHEVHRRNLAEGKQKWSVDHIIELSLGGPHTLANLQIMEMKDNLAKSHKTRKAVKSIRPFKIKYETRG